jgi:hypothetical protein
LAKETGLEAMEWQLEGGQVFEEGSTRRLTVYYTAQGETPLPDSPEPRELRWFTPLDALNVPDRDLRLGGWHEVERNILLEISHSLEAEPRADTDAELPDLLELFEEAYQLDDRFRNGKPLHKTVIRVGTLFIRVTGKGVNRRYRVIVPEHVGLRHALLRAYHDHPMSGHPGVDRLEQLIRRDYEWEGCREDVTEYVKTCPICQRAKTGQRRQGDLRPLSVMSKGNTFAMDFITGLPETEEGHDSILTVVDLFTKEGAAIPVSTVGLTAEKFSRIWWAHIPAQLGIPLRVLMDRDKVWVAKYTQTVFKGAGIHTAFTSGRWPQTNGQAERMNSLLEQYLRCYVAYDQRDWDERLPWAMLSINHSVSSATGFTPAFLHKGESPPEQLRLQTPPLEEFRLRFPDADPSAWSWLGRMTDSLEQARKALVKARERMAKYRQNRRPEIIYSVGQRVLLSSEAIRFLKHASERKRKLADRWLGPFAITAVKPGAVELELPQEMQCHRVFNVSFVKPYRKSERFARVYSEPPPIDVVDGQELWEIEKILDRRRRGQGYKYLVKWSGYERPEWTPASALELDVPDMVAAYDERFPRLAGAGRARRPPQRQPRAAVAASVLSALTTLTSWLSAPHELE